MPIVGIDKVADALNLKPRRVQYLVKEGLPQESRGQYDPVKCLLWYVRYLQAKLNQKDAPAGERGDAGERQERVRRLRADCEMKEFHLAERRKKLVAVTDVERAVSELVFLVKARMLAIPPRLADELMGVTGRVMRQALIEKAIHEALVQISKGPEGGILSDVL
jgi:phage terminase Nu1 subunit (DNA packaging protein)